MKHHSTTASNIDLKLRLMKLHFSDKGQILKKQIRCKALVFVFIKGDNFEFLSACEGNCLCKFVSSTCICEGALSMAGPAQWTQ